jgi:hypothetical protein
MPNTAIEDNLHGENNFILKIHAKSQCSVLVLEDVEHLTKYINCNLPFISLKFLLGENLSACCLHLLHKYKGLLEPPWIDRVLILNYPVNIF